MATAGSWSIFGKKLPEFGITEAAGRLLGKPTTSQGGSNIFGKPQAASPTPRGPLDSFSKFKLASNVA